MRLSILIWLNLLLLSGIVLSGCKRHEKQADIPDIQNIYGDIFYLDSLIQSNAIDSIELLSNQLSNTLQAYKNRAQSPDDKAILDSLNEISLVANQFLRFCIDSQSNLELLEQDIRSVETQYKSGKIKIGNYISAMLEGEQILVDLHNQFSAGFNETRICLHNQSWLINQLNPLPVQDL